MPLEPIVFACLVGGALLLVAQRPWEAGAVRPWARTLGGLAFVGAFLVVTVGTKGWPPFPPRETLHWLTYTLLGTGVVALVEERSTRWHALLLAFGAAVFVNRLLSRAGFITETSEVIAWQLGLFALWAALFWAQRELTTRYASGPLVPVSFAVATVGGATLIFDYGMGASALVLGTLAPLLGITAAIAVWRRDLQVLRGVPGPFTLALFGMLAIAVLFADAPRMALALVLAAPQAARLPLGSPERLAGAALRCVAVALVVGLAVYIGRGEPDPYGY